jgi:hypothetical protein
MFLKLGLEESNFKTDFFKEVYVVGNKIDPFLSPWTGEENIS